jgi:hypothetical protein
VGHEVQSVRNGDVEQVFPGVCHDFGSSCA